MKTLPFIFSVHVCPKGVNEKEMRKPKILKKNPTDADGYSGPTEAIVVHTGYIWFKLPFYIRIVGKERVCDVLCNLMSGKLAYF